MNIRQETGAVIIYYPRRANLPSVYRRARAMQFVSRNEMRRLNMPGREPRDNRKGEREIIRAGGTVRRANIKRNRPSPARARRGALS